MMKKVENLFIVILFLSLAGCYSQQIIKTVSDANKIKENQSLFINKPMKDLLREINTPIKWVSASPSNNLDFSVGYFIFNFVDAKQKDRLSIENKIPVTIVVYVKEYFNWDFQIRPKGKETVWTSEDVKKYETLTIVGFRVYGEGVTSK
jgi:hypothetical protein